MSHILRALEVAKRHAPPTKVPGATARPAAAAAHPATAIPSATAPSGRPNSRALIVGGVVGLVVLVGAGLWWMLRRPAPAPVEAAPPVVEPTPAANGGNAPAIDVPAASAPAAPVPPPVAAVTPPAAPPAAPPSEPSSELTEKVRTLPVGPVVEEGKRVHIAGKPTAVGDTVVEGLVLDRIFPDLLVFRDAAGNYYSRRF